MTDQVIGGLPMRPRLVPFLILFATGLIMLQEPLSKRVADLGAAQQRRHVLAQVRLRVVPQQLGDGVDRRCGASAIDQGG